MRTGKKLAFMYILFFFIALLLPTFGILTGITSNSDSNEFRILSKFPVLSPKLSLSQYPKAFDSFWNDNFGFRGWMVNTFAAVKLKVFNTTPIPSYDIMGANNWLFLNSIIDNDYKHFYKNMEFTEQDLESMRTKFLKERDWLKARNIKYAIVIVPDKEVIYPEFYPYPNNLIYNIGLEQFVNYFKHNSDISVIYLKDSLINAKAQIDLHLYYMTDTHWTNLGAFFGYQGIMKYFKKYYPDSQILNDSDFDISITDTNGGQTGDLIRINHDLIKTLDYKVNLNLKVDKKLSKHHKIYVHGDSFSVNKNGIIPEGLNYFFQFSFDNVTESNYSWQLDYDEIEKTKPELVIRESIQRNIHDWVGFANIK